MKQWKPVIASLIVISLAWGGLAVWKYVSSDTTEPGGRNNSAGTNSSELPPTNSDSGDLKYETVPLEKLPELDPLALWPNDGLRLASVDFWVMWQTTRQSKCRLLGTSDQRNWVDLGRTNAENHYLPMNMAYFGSQATFAVEFESNGKRYRSKPRTVYFGNGAYFKERTYRISVSGETNQTWPLALSGDARRLSADSFRWAFHSNEDLVPFWAPPQGDADGGSVVFGIQDPGVLGANGSAGFLQIYDGKTDTYDRALIELKR